jgi:hypothetical protein
MVVHLCQPSRTKTRAYRLTRDRGQRPLHDYAAIDGRLPPRDALDHAADSVLQPGAAVTACVATGDSTSWKLSGSSRSRSTFRGTSDTSRNGST